MFCTNCGAMVEDGQLFCTNCGSAVEQVEAAGPVVATAPAQPAMAGQPAAAHVAAAQVPAFAAQPAPAPQPAKGGGKKGLVAGIAVAAVLVAAVAGMAVAGVGPFASPSGGGAHTVTLGEDDDVVNASSQESIEHARATVGDYTGLSLEEASAALEADGLSVAEVSESYSDDVEAGLVMGQGVASGESLARGEGVGLVVSKGAAPHSYTLVEQPMTWAEAKAYCESQGGYLVCIGSAEENEQVKSLVAGSSCTLFWIGAQRDSSGSFAWVNGDAMTFTGWAAGEPNNDGGNENVAAIFQTGNGTAWYDTLNDVSAYYRPSTMAFVMEKVDQ